MLELDLVRLLDEPFLPFVVRFADDDVNFEHSLPPSSSREGDTPLGLLLGGELVARGRLGLDELAGRDRTERTAGHENAVDVVFDAGDGRNGDDVRTRVIGRRRRSGRGLAGSTALVYLR